MTYSIIGRDPATGELGIAVQSRFFGAGRVVPWIEADVGAVATQAFSHPAYGYRGLKSMREGLTPTEALERIKTEDPEPALRQVAILDAVGRRAQFTGARCVAAAGHAEGANCLAQANMMLRGTVWGAMILAFERAEGALADKLLAAMQAAEREGGDIRGAQAAALIVANAHERTIDLRVDDHADPVGEVGRLLAYSRAHARVLGATDRLQAGDFPGALADLEAAVREFPNDAEFHNRHALALMATGQLPEAREAMARAAAIAPNSVEFALRLAEVGIIPLPRDVLASMIS